ncbi:MAG TPA: transglutaminase family protein [Steroidobacteraceae bacterium]|nr:transglutaminase family protein [Steroidobacteraceae bacterium]
MNDRSTRGATRYQVRHETAYRYGADVVHSHQLLHLVPRPSAFQQCLEHEITVSPASFRRRNEIDAFGNLVTRVEFEHPHRELIVTSRMEIDLHGRPTILAADTLTWERAAADLGYRGSGPPREALEACRFRHESPYVRIKRLFTEYAAECFPRGRPILACAEALMTKLHRDIRYAPGETTISTPLPEVLKNRRGVCQDFAHLMIACLRSRGLAARYVSGYVRQTTGDDAEGLVGAGASHAWVSVYAPPHGWVELDPTNDTYVGTDHISVAWGRDFGDVSPLRGVILGGGSHALSVAVTVQRLAR